jgi:hypothetical protein
MAKPDSLIKFSGTMQGITRVRSRAYGDHFRKARTAYHLGEKMKQSAALIQEANAYAKAFKDAIDPYRRDFRYGMLWQRLVSLFKKQLQAGGSVDFSILEGEDLNKIHPFSRLFRARTTVIQSGKTLTVTTTSRYTRNLAETRADAYEHKMIVLFVDRGLQVQDFADSKFFPLQDGGEHRADWTIPEGAATAIVVLKCHIATGNVPLMLQKGQGMMVGKVVELR